MNPDPSIPDISFDTGRGPENPIITQIQQTVTVC
jgi:hypothetical protein